MKGLSHQQVIALMKKQQGSRTAKEYAEELGISGAYLSDIYAGKREPGESVLGKLGLRKSSVYVPIEKSA